MPVFAAVGLLALTLGGMPPTAGEPVRDLQRLLAEIVVLGMPLNGIGEQLFCLRNPFAFCQRGRKVGISYADKEIEFLIAQQSGSRLEIVDST